MSVLGLLFCVTIGGCGPLKKVAWETSSLGESHFAHVAWISEFEDSRRELLFSHVEEQGDVTYYPAEFQFQYRSVRIFGLDVITWGRGHVAYAKGPIGIEVDEEAGEVTGGHRNPVIYPWTCPL